MLIRSSSGEMTNEEYENKHANDTQPNTTYVWNVYYAACM
jgi:hypothetical protein